MMKLFALFVLTTLLAACDSAWIMDDLYRLLNMHVNGGWSNWSAWGSYSSCTKTCGGGTHDHTRSRSCNSPKPSRGGSYCSGSGSNTERTRCNIQHCPVNGGWSNWSSWGSYSSCTKICGGGTHEHTRSRSCNNPTPKDGGSDCSGSGSNTERTRCNVQHCPVNGGWSNWSAWGSYSSCSKTCGGGTHEHTRSRSCNSPTPKDGGSNCSGSGSNTERTRCNIQHCPVDGGWGDWTAWQDIDECSRLCGTGNKNQTRERACGDPAPQYGGKQCAGTKTEEQNVECNTDECGDRCPADKITFIADPSNKHLFYQCNGKVADLQKCSDETIWSSAINNCVYDIPAAAGEVATTAAAAATAAEAAATTVEPPAGSQAECPSSGFVYLPGKECGQFVHCVNGLAVTSQCGPGTVWNQKLTTCTFGTC